MTKRAAQLRAEGMEVTVLDYFPDEDQIAGHAMMFVVGLDLETSKQLRDIAHRYHVWVNVHDTPDLCDFNVPSIMRQGDLLISVSTGGKAPGLAKRIRHHLEKLLGLDWDKRITKLHAVRQDWKKEELSYNEMVKRMDALIDKEGWL
ncbi:MAG: hypothetical protein IPP74_05160 [Alphaproteobacteria bacterium]|nr:hypothetical protein [Alphaproteobacteria bacterium]